MKKIIKRRTLKSIALFFALNILLECFFPTMVWALTSGPSQPEYSSFEPVATTNMVNEFSGEFTYNLPVVNIPGPNGSGYAMSLSYHSGASAEEEASWVGYGWTLNPGAINRSKQATPDDFNGDNVTHWNQIKKSETISAHLTANAEAFSVDLPSLGYTVRYNNYRGFGNTFSVGDALFNGLISLDYSVSGEEPHSFSAELDPGALVEQIGVAVKAIQKASSEKGSKKKPKKELTAEQKEKKEKRERLAGKVINKGESILRQLSSYYGFQSWGREERAFSVGNYTGLSGTFSTTLGVAPTLLHIDGEMGISATYTSQDYTKSVDMSSTGMLYGATGFGATKSDYFIEKEATYNKRDRLLPIPHQAADMFVVSGEGLSGSFHVVSPQIIRCAPASVVSTTYITTGTLDVTVGLNLGVGASVGAGQQTLTLEAFTPVSDYGNDDHGISRFFRFSNDLGGNVIYSKHPETNQQSPHVGSIQSVFMAQTDLQDLTVKPGTSSYIGYSTMEDRRYHGTSLPDNNYRLLRSKTRDEKTLNHVQYDASIKDRIAELYTVNENGNTHVYGLPVFVADENSLSYNINFSGSSATVTDKYLAWRSGAAYDYISKIGESHSNAYALTHLLTQINTPDYMDRGYDGPTDDDFGGWTKFDYRPAAFYETTHSDKTNRSNWYNWRLPYTGMYYSKGEQSDSRDDMGSVQSGKKEVYYLKTVETKTHVAFFVTNKTNLTGIDALGRTLPIVGSGLDRMDAISASLVDPEGTPTAVGDKHLERLERIEVYSKSDINGKPLSIVHFDYCADGTPEVLTKGLPNSSYTDGTTKGGKLTLKRVWFEYEGVVNAKIAPYEFKYEYKDLRTIVSVDLKAKYPAVVSFANQLTDEAALSPQNPSYTPTATDGWGGHFYKGQERLNNLRPWLYQGNMPLTTDPDYTSFDPAAWQLKQIKLPSGGEILVQYEQHEYQYVQNKQALAMTSLVSPSHNGSSYVINTDDIGLPATGPDRAAYLLKLQQYLATEKIYFKFLYTLQENTAADINNCNAEYIDGFVSASADWAASPGGNIKITLESSGDYTLPYNACQSFVTRKRAGMQIPSDCNRNPEDFSFGDPITTGTAILSRIKGDLNAIIPTSCPQISDQYSYLRVPVFNAKRGGGVRVKRVLMYDKGIEANGEVLYGTEYFYQNEDGTSSGVATNEPQTMHDENALVTSIYKRNDPTWKERAMSGPERENFEGPLGESLLPPPSIGYSRVVTQNIHTGKTATGFRVSEYATAYDYPFLAYYTDCDNWRPNPVKVPAIVVNVLIDERSVSQSYQFTSNDMHGKTMRVAIFGGVYQSGTAESNYNKTFEELHDYYKPGEKVKVLQPDGTVISDYIGREETVSIEARDVEDLLEDMNTQFDASVGYYPFVPEFSGMGYITYELRTLHCTVLNKTISLTGIEKSVTTKQDGITHITENRVFGKYTGTPVVTATYDGYDKLTALPSETASVHDGSYLDYTIPAYLPYHNKGQKSKNEGVKLDFSPNLTISSNTITLPLHNKIRLFVAGDLLRLSTNGGELLCNVSAVDSVANTLTLQKSYKGTIALSGNVSTIEVLSSGYTNELNDPAAQIQTYGKSAEQIAFSGGSIPALTNVFSASVSVFSDNWSNNLVDADTNYRPITGANDYEQSKKGKWRLSESYVLKDKINDGVGLNTAGGTGMYNTAYNNSGVYTSFTGFSFSNVTSNAKWLRTNLVSVYSPDGAALEEQNSLNVKSTAVFGYKCTVPVAIAKNASYGSVKFLSYEDDLVSTNLVSNIAHTGKKSMNLIANSNAVTIPVSMDSHDKDKGLQVKFWAKAASDEENDINRYLRLNLSYNAGAVVLQPTITKVAKVGEWALYEAVIKGLKTVTYNDFVLSPVYSGTNLFYIDDLRIQPYESETACYVYDAKTMRLIASFDDQHFGLLYQYNGEGKLVRKIVETERGAKTVSETQYNVPKRSN